MIKFIDLNETKPDLLVIHPVFLNQLAEEINPDNPVESSELSAYFGIRIISSNDITPEEVIAA